MSVPGLVVGAPRSGSGKTTFTLGLVRALCRRGLAVRTAKNGPDYIDPGFHAAASAHPGINLDSWAMPAAMLRGLGLWQGLDADLVVCEGSMGLFDGVPGPPNATGSSADIAALLGWPVVLVLDVSGQSGSVAAVARGFASHRTDVRLAGLVLNQVASARHERLVREAVAAIGIPVFGALPRDGGLSLPERHLGLVQARETADLESRLDRLADFVAAHVDLDALVRAAGAASSGPEGGSPDAWRSLPRPPGQRIALAEDAAFSFVYPHLVAGWRAAGAEIVPFSPLADRGPPEDCDCCWLPGGYPELHAGTIASAGCFLAGLRRFAETRPVHGECGGYMVLGRALVDSAGHSHEMAGLLGHVTSFARRRMVLGYRAAVLGADCALGPGGARLRGHEFHYATLVDEGHDMPLCMATDAYGAVPVPAGHRRGGVSGAFFHVIAAEAPSI